MLFDRLPFRRQPEPPPPPPASASERLNMMLQDAVNRMPYVPQARIFWRDLQAEREWWPIVLPLLVWVGWRTYRRERRKLQSRAT